MLKVKLLWISFSVLILSVTIPEVSMAEWSLDVYGGETNTKNSEVEASVTSTVFIGLGRTNSHTERTDFDPSFIFGVRSGYWFEKLNSVGLALDLSYFKAEDKNVDINVFPLSLLLMLRWPLFKSEKFQNGRIQPYAAIGPGFYLCDARVDFRPNLPEEISGSDSDLGVDIRAGLSWQMHRHWAIFGEYRYTDIKISITNTDILFGITGNKESLKTHLKSNHFLLGISYRF